MSVLRRNVVIAEESHSWLVDDGTGWSHHATAAEALASVKAEDAARAELGQSTITTITWEPKTRIGRAVVKVLAS